MVSTIYIASLTPSQSKNALNKLAFAAYSIDSTLLLKYSSTQELSLTLLVLARQSQSYSDSGVVWNELVGLVTR